MRASPGRPVSGEDFFFNRDKELQVLEMHVGDGNHVLLTGQRRMGKTSVTLELGRRLELRGWVFLFADVEDATGPEDVVTAIAATARPVRQIASRLGATMMRWLGERVEELSALDFRVKFRAGLNPGTWRRHGEQLIDECAAHDQRVLLVIDELPILLKRMLRDDGHARRVDEFLSWLRAVTQGLKGSPVLVVSGSIGLEPLVQRLGMSDRINHLYPFRLGPWNRKVSTECFERLAASYGLRVDDGVANAVYDALGIGVPHHLQSFFGRLRDFTIMQGNDRVTVDDVGTVYRTELLGPSGQNDLVHYETRLKDGLDEDRYRVAMEILAEAATQAVFTGNARRCLERIYAQVIDDAPGCVTEALDVLVHDGYLESSTDGYRFPSRLLKDWWAARFRDHHVPIEKRPFARRLGFYSD